MIQEVLQGLIGQVGQQAVVQNTEIPNQFNQGVMDEVLNGLVGGLTKQVAQPGGMGAVLGLLGGASANNSSALMGNPLVSGISQGIVGNLMSKFGISNKAAQGVVTALVPVVIGMLIKKTSDPKDKSADLGGLFGDLTGGKTNGLDLGSLLSKGQAVLADGKLDMNDLGHLLGGGSNTKSSGGGDLIGGLLGGLFGKK